MLRLCLPLCLALPIAASAQQDRQWTLTVDPQTRSAAVGFGTPQSDDVVIGLSCAYGGGDVMFVDGLFSVITGPFQNRDPVPVRWETEIGSAVESGDVLVSEEGFGGVEMRFELGAILMSQLASAPDLSIGLREPFGIPPTLVDLRPNQGVVQDFIDTCAGFLTDAPQGETPALVADVGPGISGHDWQRITDIAEGDPFATVLNVVYGVPETDDVLAFGRCVIGAQGPLVTLQMSADIQGLSDDQNATLRVTSGTGQVVEIPGVVVGSQAEFGVSGIEMVLEVSDPAWLALATDPLVQVQRVGSDVGLTLTGNGPNILAPFLADCANIGDLTPESGSRPITPDNPEPGFLSCENQLRAASRDTGEVVTLTFTNATDGFRALLWFDADGTPIDLGALNPGESGAFTTDTGHVWMATDGPGNCREMIRPQSGQSAYRLTIPG
ncbi:hypothetical protein V8J82_18320 [Gymnodinialimonas sp. 2305UL16-5]|uniref:hypothetical protein n=1 Tax=Gymnodinialimonas mytili TaxID=3126503 RepID=UPI0030B1C1F7